MRPELLFNKRGEGYSRPDTICFASSLIVVYGVDDAYCCPKVEATGTPLNNLMISCCVLTCEFNAYNGPIIDYDGAIIYSGALDVSTLLALSHGLGADIIDDYFN